MNVLAIGGCTHLYGKGPLPFLMGTSGGLKDSVTLPPSGEPLMCSKVLGADLGLPSRTTGSSRGPAVR